MPFVSVAEMAMGAEKVTWAPALSYRPTATAVPLVSESMSARAVALPMRVEPM